MAYWLIGTSASAQTFYNNVQHCDTCLTSFYADGMFNHNQQLIATGMEHYSNSTTLFLDQYISNTSNFLRHKYIDTNYYLGLQLLQNNNKTYNIFSSTQQDTGTNWNGIHSNYLIKIDSNYNLISKTILNQTSYFNSDIYRKVKIINNKFYCIGEHKDSLNSNPTLKSIGLSVYDTNANLLTRNFFHLFPNQYVYVFDVATDSNFFYITGYHITDPLDPCSVYYDGFLIKIDTLANLIWSRNFTLPYENAPKGIGITSQHNILLSGSKQPDCTLPNSIAIEENYTYSPNNIQLQNSVYGDTTLFQYGQFIQPRVNNSMMTLTYRSPSAVELRDFIFQTTNNQGQVLFEATQQVPDSCLIQSDGNYCNSFIKNPSTNGYIFLGNAMKESNIIGISYASQAWIISTDSNGCVTPNCAYPLSIQSPSLEGREVFNVYPNPTSTTIQTSPNLIKGEVQKLYSITGQLIVTTKENEINVSNLPKGVYFIQRKQHTKKIIIQ